MVHPEQQGDRPIGQEFRSDRELMPRIDRWFLLKVLHRYGIYGIAAFVVVATAGSIFALQTKNVYRSTVVASFDRRDSFTLGDEMMSVLSPEGIEQAFEARMVDPDFLGRLGAYDKLESPSKPKQWLKSILPGGEESEADRRANLVTWFSRRLIPIINGGTGLLTLNVYLDDTPEQAQLLATTAIESFIQGELKAAVARLGIKLDFLMATLAESRQRLKELQIEAGKTSETSRKPNQADEELPLDLRQREAELLDRIKMAESEVSDLNDERVRRRATLEAEYARLSSRLSANHPDLMAKRNELTSIATSSDPAESAARNLSRLRRDLWRARSEMMYPGAGEGVSGAFVSLEERLEASRVATLTSSIEELRLQKANFERQAEDPSLRTSLKVVKPATYEMKAFARKKMQMALGVVALAIATGFMVILFLEAKNPLARDAWRVARFTTQPILAQISTASLRQFRRIDPQTADRLRQKLSEARSDTKVEVRTLLAYRRLELAVNRYCQGKIICVASAGASDANRDFFYSFANVVATDSGNPILVVDFDAVDPLTTNDGPTDAPDLLDALSGRNAWREALIPRTEERAFDLLQVGRPVNGDRTRALRSESLKRVFMSLAGQYELVLVRALPESMFIENSALIGASTDLLVGIDGSSTTYGELARTLVHLGRDKLRGLIMIGT